MARSAQVYRPRCRDLEEARALIADWQQGYNERRPPSELGQRTPHEFTARLAREGYPSLGSELTHRHCRIN